MGSILSQAWFPYDRCDPSKTDVVIFSFSHSYDGEGKGQKGKGADIGFGTEISFRGERTEFGAYNKSCAVASSSGITIATIASIVFPYGRYDRSTRF